MAVELEVIEQICEDDDGWALARVRDLLRGLGRQDDLVVLEGMWHGGHIAFFDQDGALCPDWQVSGFFRHRADSPAWFVRATDTGLRWAYPGSLQTNYTQQPTDRAIMPPPDPTTPRAARG